MTWKLFSFPGLLQPRGVSALPGGSLFLPPISAVFPGEQVENLQEGFSQEAEQMLPLYRVVEAQQEE